MKVQQNRTVEFSRTVLTWIYIITQSAAIPTKVDVATLTISVKALSMWNVKYAPDIYVTSTIDAVKAIAMITNWKLSRIAKAFPYGSTYLRNVASQYMAKISSISSNMLIRLIKFFLSLSDCITYTFYKVLLGL